MESQKTIPSLSHFSNSPATYFVESPVFVITGAGKGIGRSIAEGLIARKSEFKSPRLLLTSRTQADLDELSSLCQKADIEHQVLALELSQFPQACIAAAVNSWKRIDAVIHSAGVGRFGDFLDLTEEDLRFTVETNIMGTTLLLQAAYRQMKQQRSGDIVCITSVAAETAFEQSAMYCLSKYAQKGLLEVMRLYARQDSIRILEAQPGATYTPMWGPDLDAEMISKMMTAENVARPILDALLLPQQISVEKITMRPIQGDF